MDVISRALLDLHALTTNTNRSKSETHYLDFKNHAQAYLVEACGDEAQARQFLDELFTAFLPAVLRAAAEHQGLAELECDNERSLVSEVIATKQGMLAHSPILYPLNRKCFQSVSHERPALDLGIGNGKSSQYCLAGRELDVGGDIIVSNLLGARAHGSHNELYALDMSALPFESESFRTVYALNSIYHVQGGRLNGVKEMVRVLAPGGTLALTDVSAHLNNLKPLKAFFDSLGFNDLANDFTGYFLSGYGADGSPGDPTWYASQLTGLGMVDVAVSHLMGPRLARLGYLFYDWQALFNFDSLGRLDGRSGARRLASYQAMLSSLVAPLIKLDAEDCVSEGRGGYLFITARKPGRSENLPADRLACPQCRTALSGWSCASCGRKYPIVEGIPLLATFFADAGMLQTGRVEATVI